MTTSPTTFDAPAFDPETLARCKALLWPLLHAVPGHDGAAALRHALAADASWTVFHPINELQGPAAVWDGLYAPLQAAFPDLERRTDLFFGGLWSPPPASQAGYTPPDIAGPGYWCTAVGHYIGTFKAPWLGIAPTGDTATLRFGEFYRFDAAGRQITEARVLLDILDLARQAGKPALPPSSGLDIMVPGPAPHDGLLLDVHDPAAGAASMALTLKMFSGLSAYDGRDLNSMHMERFWHPNMMWYGPCGIGTSRGIGGFQRHHQRPFLHAFPDRSSPKLKPRGHRARFAEGPFVASTGWPSVRATFTGDYLGVKATGQPIEMRVADWWRNDGTWLTENWVLIDLPHLMLQMGVDLMARVRG